ncbi:hypothetical protein [Pseudomonas sp. EMN2]|uniref:hypothetical protein n=1 Tax=Pseudomonas sp. EMN2 TaxID=2615212 RepID=UPI00129B9421|nr:hypothetical protein [Pseudomonas sp. EMN2]
MKSSETEGYNPLSLLVLLTVLSTCGGMTLPKAFDIDWWLGVGLAAMVTVSIFGVLFFYREIAKGLSHTRKEAPSSEVPGVQGLNTKLDALCKHLGVDTAR